MWKNGRTAMMRSCSATWCTEAVWSRLATRLRCVSTTPLGNPVVPLEYGSTARSRAGSTGARGAGAAVSSRVANGVAPGALPRTKITTMSGIAMSGYGLLKSMAPARVAHGGGRVKSAAPPPERLRLAHLAPMQLPDGLDGIRLVRALVRAVAHDAREAQRQATRIRRARLDAVEGDLHHQLGPHVHHVPVASRLTLDHLPPLPPGHLTPQPVERL